MIVKNVHNELANRLEIIPGIRAVKYEDDADEIQLPSGLISLPPQIRYHGTFANGMSEMDCLITILVSLVDARVRLEQIAPYGDDTGPYSVKEILETGTYTAMDVVTIHTGMFTVLTIAETTYKAFIAQGKIAGSGR